MLNRLPLTKALADMLAEATTKPCGITFAPRVEVEDDAGKKQRVVVTPPYSVLVPVIPAGFSGPAFTDPSADADWLYQVTCVALTGDQLEWMEDRVRQAWLSREDDGSFTTELDVDGMSIMDRSFAGGAGAEPLGVDQSAITVSATHQYLVKVTPQT